MRGLIVKIISGDYFVKCEEEIIKCKPLGVFRHKRITPKVGDVVEIMETRPLSKTKHCRLVKVVQEAVII